MKSIASKKNEKQAKEYTLTAHEANISAKMYYDAMLNELSEGKKSSSEKEEKSILKDSISKIVYENDPISTEAIAEKLGIEINKIKPILREMYTKDKILKFIVFDGVDMNDDFCHWRSN